MTLEAEEERKKKRGLAKRAVSLAMGSRWAEAVEVNQSILDSFSDDLEAYNRLGKALSELGRNGEAKNAFEHALSLSSHNSIATKNLDRLAKLGDDAQGVGVSAVGPLRAFIEESGKSGVTSLINLASPQLLLKLAPGHPLDLSAYGGTLKMTAPSGEYLGQVEPKLAARLVRLIRGGNRYEVVVTGVEERSLAVFIREVFRHPSQAGKTSFPSKEGSGVRTLPPSAPPRFDSGDQDGEQRETVAVKDWSDDDTEPGDDDAFNPAVHRIINPSEETESEF